MVYLSAGVCERVPGPMWVTVRAARRVEVGVVGGEERKEDQQGHTEVCAGNLGEWEGVVFPQWKEVAAWSASCYQLIRPFPGCSPQSV